MFLTSDANACKNIFMARRNTETETSNAFSVEIGTVGGVMQKVLLENGATVADALVAIGAPAGSEVRCSGEVYTATDLLDDGDVLIVLAGAKVKGA